MSCKRWTVCLGVLWLVAACAPENAASPLALYPWSAEGNAALLPATLTMGDDGCLYLVSESGERWLAAFPSPGTEWDAEEQSVQLSGVAVRVGATARFAGGEFKAGPAGIDWLQPPRPECDSSLIWFVTTLVET